MILTRDILTNGLEPINMYVADCNMNIKYVIHNKFIRDFNISKKKFNAMSECSFKLYKFYNDDETGEQKELEYFDYISKTNRVRVDNFSWFYVTCVDRTYENNSNPYINIKMYSLEYELSDNLIYINNTYDDETTDNMYRLYNPMDKEHSCLDKVISLFPHWKIGYVSPHLSNSYHDFTGIFEFQDAWTFLCKTVAESFKCVFTFDCDRRIINAYTVEELCVDSNVWLGDNLVKNIEKSDDGEKIVNTYVVSGGEDGYNGVGNLSIVDVNPAMSSEINNFSWTKQFWSENTRSQYESYQNACEAYLPRYQELSNQLTTARLDLEKLNSKVAASGDYANYGLQQLEDEDAVKMTVMSSFMSLYTNVTQTEYTNSVNAHNAILAQIEIRKSQITNKESEISTLISQLLNERPKFEDYVVSEESRNEITRSIIKADYKNDSICTYETDTMQDVLDREKELMEDAEKSLSDKCRPRFKLSVDMANMFAMPEFDGFNEQIDIGLMCHLNYDTNSKNPYHMYIKLLQIDFEGLNSSDMKIKFIFSSRTSLDSDSPFDELIDMTQSISTSVTSNMRRVKESIKSASDFDAYQKSSFDVSKQMIINAERQDIAWGEGGLFVRQRMQDGTFAPEQSAIVAGQFSITGDAWQTVGAVVGRVLVPKIEGTTITTDGSYKYGVNAELLVGKQIIGENMSIINKSGNFTISDNGLYYTNGVNTIGMNPNDGSCAFYIAKGADKTIWFDSSGDANFTGNITSSSITSGTITGAYISGGTIDGSFISGGTVLGATIKTYSVGNNASLSIRDGNIFFCEPIEGSMYDNGYIRARVVGNSYSKIIGKSSNNNIIIGHDDAVSSIYGGQRLDINCYTSSFDFKQNSSGGRVTIKNAGSIILDEGNYSSYCCTRSEYNILYDMIRSYGATISSLETRVSALESNL